jgi:hypothetical protein
VRHQLSRSWNMRIAFVAAFVLVLQSLAGSFAMGAANASPLLDAFGNPLCITGTLHQQDGADGAGHPSMPDCCTTACSMFAPVTSGDPVGNALANPLVSRDAAIKVPLETADLRVSSIHGPGSPRAPPASL